MQERTTGIILRTRPLTETSLIAYWLTPDFGRIATVAKGARRPRSPFRGKLDLFYEAEFSFIRSRRSDLHTLGEVVLCDTHEALRRDLGGLRQAAYCAALLEQATETETPVAAVYELMQGMLNHLSKQPSRPQTIFAFELKLLEELGLKPELAKCRITPGAKRIVEALLTADWRGVARLRLSDEQVTELRRFLHGFLR